MIPMAHDRESFFFTETILSYQNIDQQHARWSKKSCGSLLSRGTNGNVFAAFDGRELGLEA